MPPAPINPTSTRSSDESAARTWLPTPKAKLPIAAPFKNVRRPKAFMIQLLRVGRWPVIRAIVNIATELYDAHMVMLTK
jgi:hypothetical protein